MEKSVDALVKDAPYGGHQLLKKVQERQQLGKGVMPAKAVEVAANRGLCRTRHLPVPYGGVSASSATQVLQAKFSGTIWYIVEFCCDVCPHETRGRLAAQPQTILELSRNLQQAYAR